MRKVKLGDICTINPKSATYSDDHLLSFIPMASVGENGEIDVSETRSYCEVKKGFTGFVEDDVLFAKITPCMENGKGAIAHGLINEAGFGSTEFHVLRPDKQRITSKWLYYLTSWHIFRMEAEKNMTGSAGQKRVPKSFLESYEITLPTIEQQQAQSRALDKVIALIKLHQQQLTKLDELVKSRFIELFGDYRINEKGFDCKKGSELFKFSSGKFLPEEKRLDEGIPVYGGNGIAWYTDEPLVTFPTVIVGRVGAQCGNIHAVTTPVWITDNAIYIKEQKTTAYTLEFLTELMRMMDFYQYADFSGQPKITQKPLESLEYILPPVELQMEYTTFVKQTDKSKLAIQQSLEKLETLKKALMQEYFR